MQKIKEDLFEDFSKEFLTYILENEPDFINSFDWIMAQCCLETNYFKSDLAVIYFNPAGLKFRISLIGKVPTLYPAKYQDWEEKIENVNIDDDCAVKYIKFSPILYFMFLERWPYKGFRNYSLDGEKLIKHISNCGFCGSISTVDKNFFLDKEQYKKAVNTEYFNSIKRVYDSQKFKQKISMFKRKYVQVSNLIPYDLNLERGIL